MIDQSRPILLFSMTRICMYLNVSCTYNWIIVGGFVVIDGVPDLVSVFYLVIREPTALANGINRRQLVNRLAIFCECIRQVYSGHTTHAVTIDNNMVGFIGREIFKNVVNSIRPAVDYVSTWKFIFYLLSNMNRLSIKY